MGQPSFHSTSLDLVLVGAGRVGTAVAELLRRQGHRVTGVASRSTASAQAAADLLGAPVASLEELPPADLVLIGVGDAAIEGVAAAISPRIDGGALVCHFAGSLGLAPLQALAERGASICALHPVQACPTVEIALRRLPGSAWGVTCSPHALDRVKTLVQRDLAGLPVEVAEEHRPTWHAAAVMTSNATAALLAVGEAMLATIRIDDPERVLGPLALGTVMNALEGGGGAATLTGPAVRGDEATLRRHLDALRSTDLIAPYSLATRIVLWSAARSGRIDPETARSTLQLIG